VDTLDSEVQKYGVIVFLKRIIECRHLVTGGVV
jgi:putative component of membrane protein insertase Oxa1/YidC/SpoIIIJ protein YidD